MIRWMKKKRKTISNSNNWLSSRRIRRRCRSRRRRWRSRRRRRDTKLKYGFNSADTRRRNIRKWQKKRRSSLIVRIR